MSCRGSTYSNSTVAGREGHQKTGPGEAMTETSRVGPFSRTVSRTSIVKKLLSKARKDPIGNRPYRTYPVLVRLAEQTAEVPGGVEEP